MSFIKSLAVSIPCVVFLTACTQVSQYTKFPFSSKNEQPLSANSEQAPQPAIIIDPDCFINESEYSSLEAIEPPDVWSRIRLGYQLDEFEHKRIDSQISWFSRHPKYMQRVGKRAERYMYFIVQEIEQRGLPLEFALLPIVESAFDPFAYSPSRASGMWQIMPRTGKSLGLKQNWWYDGRRDVVASTKAALTYLEDLQKYYKGDWLMALAAYNSGIGNVAKAIRKNKKKGKPTDYWHLDLPRETKDYVPKLLALSKMVADPDKYNIALHSIPNEPFFTAISVGSQIDLAHAAELAEIDMDKLYHLNPAFNRWATDPQGPHELLVPIHVADTFEKRIREIPENKRVEWRRYKIKSGDSLSTIAQKNKISIDVLRSVNRLKGNHIRAGKTLMVPAAKKSQEHYTYSFEERVAKRYASASKREKGKQIDYTVQPGDSLWEISKQYNVSIAKLTRWNSITKRDPLKPGQTLKIWTIAPPSTASTGVVRKVSYRVRSGDSLHRIAKKFQLAVNDILKWNGINKNKYLQPGQSLTLFVDVTHARES